jgi:transcriptional antiterminator RfaH
VNRVERALFPRYLFVSLDLSRDQWRPVTGTFGVSRFITDGTRPLPVPRGFVEGMIDAVDAVGVMDLRPTLVCGNEVQLLDGPFAGQFGRLMHLDDAGRAQVLLQILGAEREIAVSTAILIPAGNSAKRR